MKKIYLWYSSRSRRFRDSIAIAITIFALVSTFFTILGCTIDDFVSCSVFMRFLIVLSIFLFIIFLFYVILGKLFNDSVDFMIGHTSVTICRGDIFTASGFRVIGCDTHFYTKVDDKIISKNSLHGKLILNHGNENDIAEAIKKEARRLKITQNSRGLYDFPLGTIIRYDSKVDNHTYLLLAMTELDDNYEAHTDMARFENMLMNMWKEIDRVYARNDIALPLLGTGISRFNDGVKEKADLLRCMLCTLNNSGVILKSKVSVLIYDEKKDIPLYEYRDLFHSIPRR